MPALDTDQSRFEELGDQNNAVASSRVQPYFFMARSIVSIATARHASGSFASRQSSSLVFVPFKLVMSLMHGELIVSALEVDREIHYNFYATLSGSHG